MSRQTVIGGIAVLLVVAGVRFSEAQFHFGTKGGLALSNHWSTEEKGDEYQVVSSSKAGGSFGLLANYVFSRYFTLQGEVLYTKKGSQQTVTVPTFPFGDIEVTYQLDYVEMPLILKTYPFRLQTVKPYTTIGPYMAFLTGKQYQFENQTLPNFEKEIAGIEKTDYGVVFGSGIEYQFYDIRFSFDYRYTMGFVDLTLPTGEMPAGMGFPPGVGFPQIELRNNCHMFILGVVY